MIINSIKYYNGIKYYNILFYAIDNHIHCSVEMIMDMGRKMRRTSHLAVRKTIEKDFFKSETPLIRFCGNNINM